MRYFLLLISLPLLLPAGQAQIMFNRAIDLTVHGYHEAMLGLVEIEDGYIIAQNSLANTYEETRVYIAQLDEGGEVVWSRPHCADSSICLSTRSGLAKLPGGGMVLIGAYRARPDAQWDGMWYEFSLSGDSMALYVFGDPDSFQELHGMQPTADGGYIAVGTTLKHDSSGDVYLVRLNADKSVRWERHYDSGYSEIGYSVGLLPDGGFAVVAKGGYFSASTIIAMRTDSLGELLWQQELGGSGDNDGRHNVSVLSDGTLLVSASTSPNGNLRRGYLAKLTLEGEIIWERNYPGGGFTLLTVPAIEVEDGSFVVSGGRNVYVPSIGRQAYHARILKVAADGDIIWERIYHGRPDIDNYLYGLHRTSDGGFIGHGSSYGPDNATLQDGWILKMDSEGISCPELGCLLVHLEAPAPGRASLSCAPNPARGWAYVDYLLPYAVEGLEVSVWDLAGRRVFYRREPARADSGSLALDVSGWPAGMYVVRLQAGGQVLGVEKLMVY
jgi:outer membrane protein assembly factor BamB